MIRYCLQDLFLSYVLGSSVPNQFIFPINQISLFKPMRGFHPTKYLHWQAGRIDWHNNSKWRQEIIRTLNLRSLIALSGTGRLHQGKRIKYIKETKMKRKILLAEEPWERNIAFRKKENWRGCGVDLVQIDNMHMKVGNILGIKLRCA